MHARLGTVLAAAALLLAGCTATPARPSKPATAGATDAWQRTLDQIDADGGVSVRTALAAFAIAIGPVPGAPVTPGQAPSVLPSGTIAVDWVLAHWAALNPAQQAAVLADLGAAPARGTSEARVVDAALTSPNIDCPGGSSADAGIYTDDIPDITSTLEAKLGVTMHLKVYVEINTKSLKGKAGMYTYGCHGNAASTGGLDSCVIHVNPEVTTYSGAEIHLYLVHEMMHCFQFNEVGGADYGLPAWYDEGSAEWAASVLGTPDASMLASWRKYLGTAGLPLFARSYDALGFYAQLAAAGDDVWGALMPMARAMVAAGYSNAAGWNAARVTSTFLNEWGSNFVEGHYPGPPWTTRAPNLPVISPELNDVNLSSGTDLKVTAVSAAAASDRLDVTAPVVVLNGGADGRISLGFSADAILPDAESKVFCTVRTACSCPVKSPHYGQVFTPMAAGTEYLGVTHGLQPASESLNGMTIEEYCTTPATACIVGSWLTTNISGRGSGGSQVTGGGADVRVVITTATLDATFTGMRAMRLSGPDLSAGEVFGGTEQDAVLFPTSSNARSGPISLTDLAAPGVTVQFEFPGKPITSPIKSDSTPISGSGRWTCSSSAMTLHLSAAGNSTTIDLSRVTS